MRVKQRTVEENAYYWGVVVDSISRYFHEPPEKIHYRIKNHFDLISTTILSTIQFEDLMNKLRVFANLELSLFIPLPNENDGAQLPQKIRKIFVNNQDLQIKSKPRQSKNGTKKLAFGTKIT